MARRVGIELSSSRCAIVEIETGGKAQRGLRVRMFRSIPWTADNAVSLVGALQQMRSSKLVGRHVTVALSGIRAAHQLMTLPPARGRDLELIAQREAKKTVPLLNEGETSSAVLTPPQHAMVAASKGDVTFVAVSAADVRARLAPLEAAGLTVDSVTTVPVALASLSTMLHRHSGEAVLGYADVNGDATTLAIVRNGVLLFAREIPLDFRAGADFAGRLGAEIKRSFLFFKQTSKLDVQQLFVCGEFPDLRLLTAPLIHALDIEVETLDSMEGIEPVSVPGRNGDVADHIGELRVASVVAADGSRRLDLLPVRAAAERESGQLYRQLLVGAAAAVLLLAAAYAYGWAATRAARNRAESLRAEIAQLEPRLRQLEQARADSGRGNAALAMLDAAHSQGPRLTRILEVTGKSAPDPLVLESFTVTANGAVWRLPMKGKVSTGTAAAAQSAFNQFLDGTSRSPYLGPPVAPPSSKLSSGELVPVASTESGEDLAGDRGGASAGVPRVNAFDAWYKPANEEAIRKGYLSVAPPRRLTPDEERQLRWVNPLYYGDYLVASQLDRDYLRTRIGDAPSVPRTTGGATPAASRPPTMVRAPSVLDFTVEFEVKK